MNQYNKCSTPVKFREVVLHFVFTPKYRLSVLIGPVAARLHQIITDRCDELGVEIIALAIQPDHVHLFCTLPRTLTRERLARYLKGRSSRWLRQEFHHLVEKSPKALWGRDYWVRSVGGGRAAVKKYIDNQ